jgi:hypothetical protein
VTARVPPFAGETVVTPAPVVARHPLEPMPPVIVSVGTTNVSLDPNSATTDAIVAFHVVMSLSAILDQNPPTGFERETSQTATTGGMGDSMPQPQNPTWPDPAVRPLIVSVSVCAVPVDAATFAIRRTHRLRTTFVVSATPEPARLIVPDPAPVTVTVAAVSCGWPTNPSRIGAVVPPG